jgi:ribokinase
MIGKVGVDAFGDELLDFLTAAGVQVDGISRSTEAATGVALVVVAESGENTIVVVPGANGLLGAGDVEGFAPAKGDVVLSQFEIPPGTIERLLGRARAAGAVTMLNPAPAKHASRHLLALADILILNETELAFLLDDPAVGTTSSDVVSAAAKRLRTNADQIVVVTLGSEGALAVTPHGDVAVSGRRVSVVDTTGAGDTFAGAMAARWVRGASLEACLVYANAAAAICVQRRGAGPSIPTVSEVEASLL